jgi:hypothetical protein
MRQLRYLRLHVMNALWTHDAMNSLTHETMILVRDLFMKVATLCLITISWKGPPDVTSSYRRVGSLIMESSAGGTVEERERTITDCRVDVEAHRRLGTVSIDALWTMCSSQCTCVLPKPIR